MELTFYNVMMLFSSSICFSIYQLLPFYDLSCSEINFPYDEMAYKPFFSNSPKNSVRFYSLMFEFSKNK